MKKLTKADKTELSRLFNLVIRTVVLPKKICLLRSTIK